MIPLLMATQAANADLLHRYSFDGAAGTTAITDSVGGANGTLVNGSVTSELNGSGQLVLDGNASSAYVTLPSGIMSQLTNATFETWVNQGLAQTWAELWTFGTNDGSTGQGTFLSMIPVDGGVGGAIGLDNHSQVIAGGTMPTGQQVCLTAVYNYSAGTATIYLNGAETGSGAVTVPINTIIDADNYLGRSQFYGLGDPYFQGTLDEFRIFNSALSPAQIEADYEAGVGITNASPGSLTAIQFNNSPNMTVGAVISPIVLGTYTGLTNTVNLSGVSGLTYSSDNTNVVVFGIDGQIHPVAVGSTTIRASYQSQNAALAVNVTLEPLVLRHRYSFNGAAGSTTITDSAGTANGTLVNGSGTSELNGSGQLVLDGNTSSAYVSLPSGIMPQLTNATFEIWVNQQLAQTWAQLWTFGTNNGSTGQQFLSMIPVDGGLGGQIGLDNGHGATAGGPMPVNQMVCLTAVYNYSAGASSIYINGAQTGSGAVSFPIYSIIDTDNYIGRSQFYGLGDPYFQGTLDEFRIYSGVPSALQLAIDTAAGPNNVVTDPGALQSVTVNASSTNVDAHGASMPMQVIANFANVSGVNVSALSQTTYGNSNPSVGTVVNGKFIPQNVGVCTVTATYGGFSGSVAMTVTDTNAWPSLLHRWRFNEPPGSTTITDVVGSVNGTVYGPAVFDGQKMSTPTNQPTSNSGGNGTPATNGVWASFPAGQGIVSGLPNEASLEIWVKWYGGAVWQEMFDFGQCSPTPGFSGSGGQYLMICPDDGANNVLRAEWNQTGYDVTMQGPNPLQVGQLCQIVFTHDQDRQLDKLYLNGQLITSAVNTALWSTLPDTDNWLARDEWPDTMFSGEYWDFRIWNGSLTAGQVANLYAAGPSTIVGPKLQISTAGSQVTLQWPANAAGFTLQSATNLVGGTWNTVAGTPTVINGLNNLTLPPTQSQTYYRLKQ
jgi:Concanavalin A-like lectin/glucanases superfamily